MSRPLKGGRARWLVEDGWLASVAGSWLKAETVSSSGNSLGWLAETNRTLWSTVAVGRLSWQGQLGRWFSGWREFAGVSSLPARVSQQQGGGVTGAAWLVAAPSAASCAAVQQHSHGPAVRMATRYRVSPIRGISLASRTSACSVSIMGIAVGQVNGVLTTAPRVP